jgi:CubicO group peptidase (beta-lactamase class C family)
MSGFSEAGLARMRHGLAALVGPKLPGVVSLVARGGEVHADALGTLGLDDPRPMQRGTIFRVASVTKPIGAAAAMVLVDEGKLRLDDPVDRWVPELANRRVLRRIDGPIDDTVAAERPITARDLMTFTFGFGVILEPPGTLPIQRKRDELGFPDGPPQPDKVPPPDEYMRRFGQLPLLHQPGARWMYNNGLDVTGVLVARIAGEPLDAFLRRRIFEPLGMKDTAFSVPAEKIDRLATSYATDPKTGALSLYDPARGGQWSHPPAFPSAAGGLVSTADDLLAFGEMLLGRGRRGATRVLSEASVKEMMTDQLTPAQKAATRWFPEDFFETHGWGLGMAMVTRSDDPAEPVGKAGWDGGMGTSFAVDTERGLVGVLLTQQMWTSPNPPAVCRDFWSLAYQALA